MAMLGFMALGALVAFVTKRKSGATDKPDTQQTAQ
jgi:hypothetical protein